MDNFYGPLSVCTTGFTVNIMRSYDTIFELGKTGAGRDITKKRKGVSRYVASTFITGDL